MPPVIKDSKTYDSILVVVDRFTKLVYYFPTRKSVDAAALTDLLYRKLFILTGSPKSLLSDRGSVFTSE